MLRPSPRSRALVLCLVAAGACARRPADTASVPAAVAVAERFAVGSISDRREQWRITFTPDGDTAYFATSEGWFPQTRQATIYTSHRRGATWTPPRVAPFSGVFSDMDPAISPDGRRLYFSSIRPAPGSQRDDIDLWMVERTGAGWGTPVRLGDEVNTAQDELYPSVAADGTLWYAGGPRAPVAGEHWDIFRAAPSGAGFARGERLGDAINRAPRAGEPPQAAWEFNPEISPDGRRLVFTSLRAGGYGLGDLYVSHLRDGAWTPAENLGPDVNTGADEYHPTVSPDGAWLYFARRQPLAGDFYRIATGGVAALGAPGASAVAPRTLAMAFNEAVRAQSVGDMEGMRRHLRTAHRMAPDNGQVLYFLAREEARAGDTTQALALLARLAVQGHARDPRTDTMFVRLMTPARGAFEAASARIAAAATPVVRSETLFVLRDSAFIPEGLARHGATYFVGSLHRGSIVQWRADEGERAFTPSEGEGAQVVGIAVDSARGLVWHAMLNRAFDAPRHSNGGGGWASLHSHMIGTPNTTRSYSVPEPGVPHFLNDMVVTAGGDVYVTDTEAHAVWRLRQGAMALERATAGQPFMFPNGIALSPDGRRLYVAHLEGISVATMGDGTLAFSPMARPAGVSAGGIDGLYACGGGLVAVQSLSGFQQVTRFDLDARGTAIVAATPLERRHPIHDWATTGVVTGAGDFAYIANAQLRRLSAVGALSPPVRPGNSAVLLLRGACTPR